MTERLRQSMQTVNGVTTVIHHEQGGKRIHQKRNHLETASIELAAGVDLHVILQWLRETVVDEEIIQSWVVSVAHTETEEAHAA